MNKSIEPHQTFRIWKKTLKKLRMIHALTGLSIVSILEQLATQELDRLQTEQQNADPENL